MKTISELLKKNTGRSKPVVFAFGRLNPPTIGHQKLIERVITIAKMIVFFKLSFNIFCI